MAITFDTTADSAMQSTQSYTTSITVGSGTNGILIAVVGTLAQQVDTVKDGATSLTLAVTSGVGEPEVNIYYELNPSSGSHTITTNLLGADTSNTGLISLFGVDQTTITDGSNSQQANGADPSMSVTTTSNTDWIVDGLALDQTPFTAVNCGQTQDIANSNATPAFLFGMSHEGPVGSSTVCWSTGGNAANYGYSAVAFLAAAALPPTVFPLRMRMGMGV